MIGLPVSAEPFPERIVVALIASDNNDRLHRWGEPAVIQNIDGPPDVHFIGFFWVFVAIQNPCPSGKVEYDLGSGAEKGKRQFVVVSDIPPNIMDGIGDARYHEIIPRCPRIESIPRNIGP
jgi:hypothetical protein